MSTEQGRRAQQTADSLGSGSVMNMEQVVRVTVGAKLLLSGEHSVFHGAPAVGLPFPLYLRLSFYPNTPLKNIPFGERQKHAKHRNSTSAQRDAQQLASENKTDTPLLSPAMQKLLCKYPHFVEEITQKITEIVGSGGQLDIKSDIPIGSGLGSSAALCVAIARLIGLLRDDENAASTVWKEAHHLERHFHTPSSGIDTGIITHATPIIFWHRRGAGAQENNNRSGAQENQRRGAQKPRRRGAGAQEPPQCGGDQENANIANDLTTDPSARYQLQPFRSGVSLVMLIVVLPRGALSTRKMIAAVNTARNRDVMRQFCVESERCAKQCAELTTNRGSVDDPPPAAFFRSIQRLHRLQQQLCISTDETDAVISEACKHGAEAGKVSGAGGGGAVFALFRDRATFTNALSYLLRFCEARYTRGYHLYGGEWSRGAWQWFERM